MHIIYFHFANKFTSFLEVRSISKLNPHFTKLYSHHRLPRHKLVRNYFTIFEAHKMTDRNAPTFMLLCNVMHAKYTNTTI